MIKIVAILGATSHIAKGLIAEYSLQGNCSLKLYARSPEKVDTFLKKQAIGKGAIEIFSISDFKDAQFDIVINCIGVGTVNNLNDEYFRYFTTTEEFDNLVITQLKKNPHAFYISISSGSIYGRQSEPCRSNTELHLQPNNINKSQYYSIARLYSENKHRSLTHLNIIDIRIFNFISPFINLNDSYLITDILKAIKNKEEFKTNNSELIRDYISPAELYTAIECLTNNTCLNDSFDIYSKSPISKSELLSFCQKEYQMQISISTNEVISGTGSKSVYCSAYKKIEKHGYAPQYSSLENIQRTIDTILSSE